MIEKGKMICHDVNKPENDESHMIKMSEKELPQNGDIVENNLIVEIEGSKERKVNEKNLSIETENNAVYPYGAGDEYLLFFQEDDLSEKRLSDDVFELSRIAKYLRGESDSDEDWINDKRVFATVGFVESGSPADEAGLRRNDQLIQFGYLSATNFNNIHQVQKVSRSSIYRPLPIKVKRGEEELKLVVTPRAWEKEGLVGCQIIRCLF
ncbi:probable 26S proteasome non-ATPase regulatory subunit 9 [Melitaea cinxia]|uniref:probable 26S proteasome non-ATPase regulatory subunit 9 n=1 Tax=Melitaea cinxia TaxID=113334 RepID=UPI001E270989|nr:probable 26S proteasome non-ATPase regulatory subunit 9 [Melitaea cinxia]